MRPELVQKVEFRNVTDQSLFVGEEIGFGDVSIGIYRWIGRSQRVAVVGIHYDGIDLVEMAKENSNIFSRSLRHVSQAVKDQLVVTFGSKFLFEKWSDDGPSFSVSLYVF